MNIDEKVKYLMQGTEYGDQHMAHAMAIELKDRLIEAEQSGRPLKIYCGYDPRTTDLHIGHTVTMRKLRQFQELGHEVTFVIGTYTSLIGDPSDKDKLRPQLTPDEVLENARTYAEQAYRVLDREKTIIRYNAKWLSQLSFADLIKLASNFTIQQFLTRENFRIRWDNNEPIHLHELFYSLMQGYDAHVLETDVQVGGTDQLFNIMTASRKIMSYYGQKPNIGIILDILPGTDGEVKMSKSLGNHIPLNTTPEDMFGKVMSIPDKAMPKYAKLATSWQTDTVNEFCEALNKGSIHPRDAKMKLAFEIVSIFYSQKEAEEAKMHFITLFQKGDIPENIPTYELDQPKLLLDILVDVGLIDSKNQGRRLIEQNGIKFNGVIVADFNAEVNAKGLIQVGKRKFIRVLKG